jgi:hypothetical protein
MAQDYAKRKNSARGSKSTTRKGKTSPKTTSEAPSVWRWYGAGVVSGVFASLLIYLGMLPADPGDSNGTPRAAATAAPVEEPPKPRFDFYTLLPEQTIEVEVDPGEIAKNRTSPSMELYLLQAGSFRQRKDADRRRAELILLGLEPKIEDTSGDNGRSIIRFRALEFSPPHPISARVAAGDHNGTI